MTDYDKLLQENQELKRENQALKQRLADVESGIIDSFETWSFAKVVHTGGTGYLPVSPPDNLIPPQED